MEMKEVKMPQTPERRKEYYQENKAKIRAAAHAWYQNNKEAAAAHQREYQHTHREQENEARLRRRATRYEVERSGAVQRLYGISREKYLQMDKDQGGHCAICGNKEGRRKLDVDHDHVTGKVRALLCSRCNTVLGLMDESIEKMQLAIEYLKSYGNEDNAPEIAPSAT
jgi:hypothetical protein